MMSRNRIEKNIIKYIFRIFAAGVLLYFLLGQMILPSEGMMREKEDCTEYAGEWVYRAPDGEMSVFTAPGQVDAGRGEKVRVDTVLPASVPDGWGLLFRSTRQNIEAYVDGELRAEYGTEGSRLFGKTSPSCYVFIRLAPEDAGKTLSLYTQTDSEYSGVVGTVYYGAEMGIWLKLIHENAMGVMLALALILLGFCAVASSVVVRLRCQKKIPLEHLSWFVFLAGIWLLGNTGVCQLLFPNISVVSEISFFMVMLIPFPFLFFADMVQKERYHRFYVIVEALLAADFVICTVLQCTDTVDFSDAIFCMVFCFFAAIALVGASTVVDAVKKYVREYFLIAIGIGVICAAFVVQILSYLLLSEPYSVHWLVGGLLVLLALTAVTAVRDFLQLEKEKQEAVLASESKAQFLANMSHEIRTPINAVLGMDEMILRECLDDSIMEYARDIESAGRSLLSLINDILDFSKIESGKMEIISAEYALASVLNDCYHMAVMRARDKELELKVENDPSLPIMLVGDEVRVRQIITNLLTNGIKYTEQGSVMLSLSGEKDGNGGILLLVKVEDTGIGISKEGQEKMFNSFQRLDELRNKNIEGTGLGLAITNQLVSLMGGRIWVESEIGKGSAFYVEIPQKIADATEMGDFEQRYKEMLSQIERYKESFTAPEARILVVDDVKMNLRVISGFLKNTKIQVDTAESGMQCLEMVQRKAYHIIFLDHMMPEMDGMETLRRMEELEDCPSRNAKVIMLTANAIMGAKEEYLKKGFRDYLSKPVRSEDLEEMVVRHLPPELVMFESYETVWAEPEEPDEEEKSGAGSGAAGEGGGSGAAPSAGGSGAALSAGGSGAVPDARGGAPADAGEPAEKTFLQKLDFLDTGTGLSYCADDEEFYREILGDYMSGNKVGELQMLFGTSDWENYRIQVHALKSTSLSIGANELSEEAKALEMASKDNDIAYIRAHHADMIGHYIKTLDKLKEALE